MSQALVSISVSSYENAHFIEETLNSIYNQTYSNIELVIVDDFSKDNSIEIINNWIEKYGKRFESVKLIRHEKNMGVCVVANAMIKNSKGDYLSLIASDDTMVPEKTAQQVSILNESDAETGMVYSNGYLMAEDSSPMEGLFIERFRQDLKNPPSGWIFEELVTGNFIPAMSVMIKREVFETVGFFDEELVFEDYDMWLRISHKYKIIFLDKPLVKYRIRKSSLTHTITKWNPSIIRVFFKHIQFESVKKKLEEIAYEAYENKDKESLLLLKKEKKSISNVKWVNLFSKLGIPFFLGRRILHYVKSK